MRAQVDAALVAGEPHRAIAARHGVSKASVTRHFGHATRVSAARAKVESAHERTILERVRELQQQTKDMLARALATAEEEPDALGSVRELGRLYELEAKLTGAMAPKKVEHSQALRNMSAEEHIVALRKLEAEVAEERARVEAEAGTTLQ